MITSAPRSRQRSLLGPVTIGSTFSCANGDSGGTIAEVSVPRPVAEGAHHISCDSIRCAFGVPGYISHGPLPGVDEMPVVAVVAPGM